MEYMKKILIADDSKINQDLITEILGDNYEYVYADNGVEIIDYLSSGNQADIVLLDINMPYMDGFEVLKIMNERKWLEEIPVVVISAENDYKFLQKAYSLGATDYITRPISAITVRFRVENTLMLYSKQKQLVHLVEQQVREHEEINTAMISIFSHTIEIRNNESGKHMLNIRDISDLILHRLKAISDRYDLSEKKISTISVLSALHDIGKITIPRKILNKPGKLTEEEWEIMKTHSAKGDEIIVSSNVNQSNYVVKTAREICRWHHERWDGKGYPDGISGDDIPISAQVVAMADVYDALTSDRCYKKAFSHEEAIYMIKNGKCGAFNPLLLQCLNDVAEKLKKLSQGKSEDGYNYENEAQILTLEMLKKGELPLDDRAERLLENEKVKKEFLKENIGGIQFEYDCPSKKVIFTNWYEKNNRTKTLYISEGENINLLSKEDWNRLVSRLKTTSRENPDTEMTALIPVNGNYRWHRIKAKTIWSNRGEDYIGVIGQFTDINNEVTSSGIEKVFDRESNFGSAFDLIRNVFGTVRLVDPTDYKVLKLSKDGKLVKTQQNCYELWNRHCCCKNCSSAEAIKCNGLTTKLETKDGEIFSVISKNIAVGGRECALEIAFSMAEVGKDSKSPLLSEKTRFFLLNFYKDSLTEAYSRMYLEDFKANLENTDAIAIIDVDGFKRINDTYGHPVGDLALKHISEIIDETVLDRGVVIRYGGDEFLVLCNNISESDFNGLINKIKDRVHSSALKEYPQIQLDISIGGSYHAKSLSEGISQADREMYKNKTNSHTEEQ